MSDELFQSIKNCIENKTEDKNELKKSINKIIDKYYKVKREPTEYNIFVKEQILLLKDNN